MNRAETIREVCAIVSLAYHSIGDFSRPSDGFCDRCPAARNGEEWHYQNAGHMVDYVRLAVLEKLKRDGHEIAKGFDPKTGKEIR